MRTVALEEHTAYQTTGGSEGAEEPNHSLLLSNGYFSLAEPMGSQRTREHG